MSLWTSPSPRTKTIFFPSGDQLGPKQPPAVGSEVGAPHSNCPEPTCTWISRRPLPSECTSHSELWTSSLTRLEKTSSLPCGDHDGAEVQQGPIFFLPVPLVLTIEGPDLASHSSSGRSQHGA